MSNEQNNSGISISVSNEAVASISNTFLELRKVGSFDLAKVLEFGERIGDKAIAALTAVEMARASRREVHVHTEKTTKV